MKITTYLLSTENIDYHQIYILIDVLRATSTIVTAIASGIKEVKVLKNAEDTYELRKYGYKIAGERNAEIIKNFDFDNSPLKLIKGYKEKPFDKLALTTTNGAKTMDIINDMGDVVALSLLNVESVNRFLKNYNDIAIVCSGTYNRVSLEDVYAASLLIELLKSQYKCELNDGSFIALNLAKMKEKEIKNSEHSERLLKLGKNDDLEFCFRKNLYDVVPFSLRKTYSFRNKK
ncbi:MAG: 2-phosphosulfolactate phosphatase [Thermotogae bacterium]|nr:2-phosphosulfolactate phosphatase [Thermotogota bacterium]